MLGCSLPFPPWLLWQVSPATDEGREGGREGGGEKGKGGERERGRKGKGEKGREGGIHRAV